MIQNLGGTHEQTVSPHKNSIFNIPFHSRNPDQFKALLNGFVQRSDTIAIVAPINQINLCIFHFLLSHMVIGIVSDDNQIIIIVNHEICAQFHNNISI